VADQRGWQTHYPLTADLSGILAGAHHERPDTVRRPFVQVGAVSLVRACRALIEAWARHLARRIEQASATLDRAGLLDDSNPAAVERMLRRNAVEAPLETPLDLPAPIR
jgi:hypothetical protein